MPKKKSLNIKKEGQFKPSKFSKHYIKLAKVLGKLWVCDITAI